MTLMLLCAGEGTRLHPHTQVLPKPAIPFLTVPMAAYGLEWAREISPARTVVNTFHLADRVHSLFKNLNPADLKFSDEQPQLMGPGGGIMKARPHLDGADFLVMNGDEVFLPAKSGQLAAAARRHRESDALATMMVMDYPGIGTKFGGIWVDERENVLGFGKTRPANAKKGWHYIGALFLSPRIFAYLPSGVPSNILHDGLSKGMADGEKVRIAVVEGWWHETGNEADLLTGSEDALNLLFEKNSAPGDFLRAVLAQRRPRAEWKRRDGLTILGASGIPNDVSSCAGFLVLGEDARPVAGTKNAILGDGVRPRQALQNQMLLKT